MFRTQSHNGVMVLADVIYISLVTSILNYTGIDEALDICPSLCAVHKIVIRMKV